MFGRRSLHLYTFSLLLLLTVSMNARASLDGVECRTLPNGMRLLVREEHNAPLIAIDVWVRAGSSLENKDESGAAHFLEHMIFKGTPTRKVGQIDEEIENLGSMLSAGTTRDGAHFYTTVGSQYAGTALDVIADALQNATFDPTELERERRVIMDEMAKTENDRKKVAVNRVCFQLFSDAPYARPILGIPESLSHIPRDTVAAFHRRLYAPNNTTVVIVGNITVSAAQEAVTHAFGAWQKRDVPDLPAFLDTAASSTTTHPAEAPSGATKALLGIGFRGPAASDELNVCAAYATCLLLADSRGGAITHSLSKLGINAATDCEFSNLRGPGLFMLYATVAPVRLTSVRDTISDEITKLKSSPVPTGDLEFVKRRILGARLFDTETFAGQARAIGLSDMLGDYQMAVRFDETLKKLTPSDIQAFAKKYLDTKYRAETIISEEVAP